MKLARNTSVGLDICPRCTFHHQNETDKRNGWIICRRCKTRFNTRVSKVPTARRAEMDTIDGLSTTLATEATASHHAQRPSDSDTQSTFKMFRRLIVEILADKEVRMDDLSVGRQVPETTEGPHRRKIHIPDPQNDNFPCRTLLNVCRYLFGQGATTEASGDSTVDGLFHGLSSTWHFDSGRQIKLGYGQGPSAEAAKDAAARAAIAYLSKEYPHGVAWSF
ncbi:hypothetical protein BKA70DRAFT_599188 [Coprinopsis sp. MPI-PUGE-AT-0042]|nr:hypothetical protein BKA70DRAFT_599188 [Coprinopsis sp. MPI-PUGE-AT-0042]